MKVTVKFEHTHHGVTYPAGTVLELSDEQGRWLCNQKLENKPCAEPYAGDQPAANPAETH